MKAKCKQSFFFSANPRLIFGALRLIMAQILGKGSYFSVIYYVMEFYLLGKLLFLLWLLGIANIIAILIPR